MGRIWAAHGPHGFDLVCILAGLGVAGKSTTLDQVFEKAPPAGFKPAHTAPESVAVLAADLHKCALGGSGGARTVHRPSRRGLRPVHDDLPVAVTILRKAAAAVEEVVPAKGRSRLSPSRPLTEAMAIGPAPNAGSPPRW